MRLTCGMVHTPRIALVLAAKQTLRVACRLRKLRLGDVARILLRLREVDRHIEIPELRRRFPRDVLVDARLADVVRGDAQRIVVVRCLARRFFIVCAERTHDLGWARHHTVHDARIEEVALVCRPLDQPLLCSVVEHTLQNRRCRFKRFIHLFGHIVLDVQHIKEAVRRIDLVLGCNQPLLTRKVQEATDFMLNVTHDASSRPSPHTRADGSHAISTPSRSPAPHP